MAAKALGTWSLGQEARARSKLKAVLPDYLTEGLAGVFIGTSVATASASRGCYYAGPGNKFWELLWDAGLTGDRLLQPEKDSTLLR